MKLLLIFIAALFIPGMAFTQEKEINPLYTLPKIIPGKNSNSL